MSQTGFVILLAVVTFLFGAVGAIVLSRADRPLHVGALAWVVRGLVGLGFTAIAVGVYAAIKQAGFSGDDGDFAAQALASSLMFALTYGGVLLGLAAIIHLLDERRDTHRRP